MENDPVSSFGGTESTVTFGDGGKGFKGFQVSVLNAEILSDQAYDLWDAMNSGYAHFQTLPEGNYTIPATDKIKVTSRVTHLDPTNGETGRGEYDGWFIGSYTTADKRPLNLLLSPYLIDIQEQNRRHQI